MGRPFCRAALGGVSDETDIRGFRRTYVGSMPGLFIHKMSEAGVNNPVILLDEIDKVASGKAHRGDPSAALLEVLDPEQNHAFTDNYINAPVDLSQVTFIATANTTYTIPEPLLDRMELIYLSGYVDVEKLQIARKYLIPKQLRANALTPDQLDIDDKTIIDIISKYSHESGVRTLERRIGAVCRWKAVEVSKYRDRLAQAKAENRGDVEPYNPVVRQEDLEEILGNDHRIPREIEDDDSVQPGHAVGLAYTGDGTGCILHIETASMPGHGHLVGLTIQFHSSA